MSPSRNVLVAVDASDRASAVIEQGVKLATMLGARIVLLRAIPALKELPVALHVPLTSLQQDMRNEAERDLKQLAQKIPAAALESVLVEEGSAWRAICHAAGRLKSEAVVIGAYSHGGLDQLLGSTASRVANHAPCSVLVVRTEAPS